MRQLRGGGLWIPGTADIYGAPHEILLPRLLQERNGARPAQADGAHDPAARQEAKGTMKNRFSEILKACRKNSGFTQRQVGDMAGLSSDSISKWERGVFIPNIVDFERILNVYGLTLMIGKLQERRK